MGKITDLRENDNRGDATISISRSVQTRYRQAVAISPWIRLDVSDISRGGNDNAQLLKQ